MSLQDKTQQSTLDEDALPRQSIKQVAHDLHSEVANIMNVISSSPEIPQEKRAAMTELLLTVDAIVTDLLIEATSYDTHQFSTSEGSWLH